MPLVVLFCFPNHLASRASKWSPNEAKERVQPCTTGLRASNGSKLAPNRRKMIRRVFVGTSIRALFESEKPEPDQF